MRILLHPDSLVEYLKLSTYVAKYASISKKIVDDLILKSYEKELGEDLFQTWFANEQSQIYYHRNDPVTEKPTINLDPQSSDQIKLAYFWSKIIIKSDTKSKIYNDVSHNLGIHICRVEQNSPDLLPANENPLYEWAMISDQRIQAKTIIRYFEHHSNFILIDKFLKPNSVYINNLIFILNHANPQFKLKLISDCSELELTTIKDRVKSRFPSSTVSTGKLVTTKNRHDRHLTIDNTFQIDITAGFDSIKFTSTSPTEILALGETKISIYSILNSTLVETISINDSGVIRDIKVKLYNQST